MNGIPSLPAFVFTNEGTKEGIRNRHMCLLVDTPCITKLGEVQGASGVSGFEVRHLVPQIDIIALLTSLRGRGARGCCL